jgi:hypothetical protein
MSTERDDYGLQPFKRLAVATPGANHASGEALPDSYNPSAAWTKARADAMAASFEEQRLTHETDVAAYYIANGPFKFPMGPARWTLRAEDRTRAETLTLSPLPSRSVRELVKARIINTTGVVIEEWRKACEELRL